MSRENGRAVGHCANALAWLIVSSFTQAAWAGSFSVNPVQISLPDDRKATSLTIKNSDVAPVSIRVRTLAWTQGDGLDHYSPTSNLLVSPPIFTIQPGATQLLRLGLKNRGAVGAYRVILEEIPTQKPVVGQVQVTLRLNLPLYILPKGGGKPDVTWRAWREQDGRIIVEGRNEGTLHQKITELEAEQGGKTIVLTKQMGVVLPGARRIWKVTPGIQLKAGSEFSIIARTPAGVTRTRALLESR